MKLLGKNLIDSVETSSNIPHEICKLIIEYDMEPCYIVKDIGKYNDNIVTYMHHKNTNTLILIFKSCIELLYLSNNHNTKVIKVIKNIPIDTSTIIQLVEWHDYIVIEWQGCTFFNMKLCTFQHCPNLGAIRVDPMSQILYAHDGTYFNSTTISFKTLDDYNNYINCHGHYTNVSIPRDYRMIYTVNKSKQSSKLTLDWIQPVNDKWYMSSGYTLEIWQKENLSDHYRQLNIFSSNPKRKTRKTAKIHQYWADLLPSSTKISHVIIQNEEDYFISLVFFHFTNNNTDVNQSDSIKIPLLNKGKHVRNVWFVTDSCIIVETDIFYYIYSLSHNAYIDCIEKDRTIIFS